VVAVGVSLAMSVGATAMSATVNTVPPGTAPEPTSRPSTDTVPVDTDAPSPSTTPVDSTSANTEVPTDSVAASDPTLDNEQEESVSLWWWVGGGLVAMAAVGGIAFSLRRRADDETWAHTASTTCDTGRALAATIESHLHEAAEWAPPERVEHQRERFTASLHQADDAPNAELIELWATVTARNDALGRALDALEIGTPIGTASDTLAPSLHDLAAALTALEHEAATVVYGAALPSTRATG